MEVHSSKNNDFEKAKDCWDCKDTKLEKDGKGSFPLSPPFSTGAFEFSHFHFCTHKGVGCVAVHRSCETTDLANSKSKSTERRCKLARFTFKLFKPYGEISVPFTRVV